jgi:hypothetical protein
MATTISGTAGVTFPAGGVGNPASAVVGLTDTQTLTNKTLTSPNIGGTPAMNASVITSGTAVASTSGTSIDFTSIPSWVKRITVMFKSVSTSATSNYLLQVGDSGGIENTGYTSGASSRIGDVTSSSGFILCYQLDAVESAQGNIVLTSQDATNNTWVLTGGLYNSGRSNSLSAGVKSLSATLDRVRITTVNGTDTFDAGSINILYE